MHTPEPKPLPDLPDLPPPYPCTPTSNTSNSTRAGPSAPNGAFACLLLARTDRLRLLNFPQGVFPVVGDAVRKGWSLGIQQEGSFDGQGLTYEWKLAGRPWSGQGSQGIDARRLLARVLQTLEAAGWHLFTSVDLTKNVWDKDTLIFRQGPARQRYFFSISFHETDKVRLIDPPAVSGNHDAVVDAFEQACRTWPLGVQDFREKEDRAFQCKLYGKPWWTSDGKEVNAGRMLVCTILNMMDVLGFELVGSVSMTLGRGDDTSDLDSWFFAAKI